jgi:hypothetical protein
MRASQAEKAARFQALHAGPGAFGRLFLGQLTEALALPSRWHS